MMSQSKTLLHINENDHLLFHFGYELSVSFWFHFGFGVWVFCRMLRKE